MLEAKLVHAIEERKREIADSLVQHPAEDLAKYNRQVGHYHGLQNAIDILNELLRADDDR